MGQKIFAGDGSASSISGAFADDIMAVGALTATVNDFAPNAFDQINYKNAGTWQLTSLSAVSITGIQGGQPGRRIVLMNSGSFAITLPAESGASAAENRIAQAVTIAAGTSATLQYNAVTQRWVVQSPGSNGQAATPTTISDVVAGTINDYAPTGFDANTGLLVLASTNAQISGLLAGGDQQKLVIYNSDFTHTLTLLTENGGSAAANRFKIGGPADLAIQGGGSIALVYSTTVQRWLVQA